MLAHRLCSAIDTVIYEDGTPVFATGELEVLLFWLLKGDSVATW